MTAQERFVHAMQTLPLVAILRGLRPDECVHVGQALLDAGWSLLEVPLNSPSPLESIARLSQAFPEALVGAGTVLTPEAVREVHAAGGRVVVSPRFREDVVHETRRLGMVALPGVMTPSEAFAALAAGADGLKLFPAEMIPPSAVKALRAVLPAGTPLMPVGGISTANLAAYLSAGASGFGIGSSLYRPGASATDVGEAARAFATCLTAIMRS